MSFAVCWIDLWEAFGMAKPARNRKGSKKREKMLADRAATHRSYARDHEFPKFVINDRLANPDFSRLVRKIARSIDLTDPALFSEGVREFFQLVRTKGDQQARQFLIDELNLRGEDEAVQARGLGLPASLVGEELLKRLAEENQELFPYNDAEVLIKGNVIAIGLSSMLRRSTNFGNVYHSQMRLKIEHDGHDCILAFSKHAITAICDRFKPDYLTYGGLGDAHALFSYLAYAEVVSLSDGKPAIAIFDMCASPGFWEYNNYVRRCMPDAKPRPMKDWYRTGRPYAYRVGYCPVVRNGEYLVAKTFLSPGYSKTPERRLICEKASSASEKQRLIHLAENLDYETLRRGRAMDAIEWFHKNGVPQVIDPPSPLFDNDYFERKRGW